MSEKKKTTKFYTEMVFASIFSLIAASLWINLTQKFIAAYFKEQPGAEIAWALAITLLAIFSLQYMFSDVPAPQTN